METEAAGSFQQDEGEPLYYCYNLFIIVTIVVIVTIITVIVVLIVVISNTSIDSIISGMIAFFFYCTFPLYSLASSVLYY